MPRTALYAERLYAENICLVITTSWAKSDSDVVLTAEKKKSPNFPSDQK